MTDWFGASIKMQQQMVDAQRASLKAGQDMLAAGDTAVRLQEAARKAGEAQMAAWTSWMTLWGIGR